MYPRLSESEHELGASEEGQRRLQQELECCRGELQDAVARGHAAHSEAVSYLTSMRLRDRQAEMDR